jgi:tetratricopeptide (TPR) repeat protein
MKKHKKNLFSRVSWLSIIAAILIIANIFFSVCLLITLENQNYVIKDINNQLKNPPTSSDSIYIKYYKELSDKTDDAISRILTAVGIIAGVIGLFTVFMAFRAPHDIDNRIEELKDELKSAQEAAEESKYQAKIASALTEETTRTRIAELTEVIKEFPNKPNAYNLRGNCKMSLEQYENAIVDYEIALKLGIQDSVFYTNMATAYYYKKEYTKAIYYSNKSIDKNPDVPSTYIVRAVSYSMIGKKENAFTDFEKVLSIDKDHANCHLLRSNYYKSLSDEEKDPLKREYYIVEAKKDIEKAFELDPEDADIIRLRNIILSIPCNNTKASNSISNLDTTINKPKRKKILGHKDTNNPEDTSPPISL